MINRLKVRSLKHDITAAMQAKPGQDSYMLMDHPSDEVLAEVRPHFPEWDIYMQSFSGGSALMVTRKTSS